MKVVLIGGGGFRAPIAWRSTSPIAGVDQVVLYDVSETRLQHVAAVIEGLRRERGQGPPIRTTTVLDDALEGAGIVFCAIRVGGLEGRVIDETIPQREGVLGQETVGPGGISFALRTVPVMLDIARVAARRAPNAWFLNFTNPAGLVTEALRGVLGDRVVGICDAPAGLCAHVAEALGKSPDELHFDYAGLNHLGWLLAAQERGHDQLPDLLADETRLERVPEAVMLGLEHVRRLEAIPNEYLVYYEAAAAIVAANNTGPTRAEIIKSHEDLFYAERQATPEAALGAWRRARDARFGTYMAEVRAAKEAGTVSDEQTGTLEEGGAAEAGYAAIAAGFLGAVQGHGTAELMLNVANCGRLEFLDDDAVVEVSCRVTPGGPQVLPGNPLPPESAELVARVKEVERLTIRAAVDGSRSLALEALAAHPIVTSRAVAERILDGYLAAWPSLAERLQ
jgi:6-phospho-beta-glucosidase